MKLPADDADLAILSLGLCLTQALLLKSRYPAEIQTELQERISELLVRIRHVRLTPDYDYTNNNTEEET